MELVRVANSPVSETVCVDRSLGSGRAVGTRPSARWPEIFGRFTPPRAYAPSGPRLCGGDGCGKGSDRSRGRRTGVPRPQYTPGALAPLRAAVGHIAVGTVLCRSALQDNGATNR
ncbi:hypothetical protein GCM10010343_40350 [Streptomyces avidinii]|nr:hypothetical protein GCM10010343_40350 [Streptomyces avidinii]